MLSKVIPMLLAEVVFVSLPASGMSLKQFRQFSPEERSMYIAAAVSMLTYAYAANGHVDQARCLRTWYFGRDGKDAIGPRELVKAIGVAANLDPLNHHIEGVILGVADKACGPVMPVAAKP